MSIRVNVLGNIRVVDDDGQTLKLPKKARALAAYLVFQPGRRASRERLADLLWPYQCKEKIRHSLRNCIFELRKRVRVDVLDPTFFNVGLADGVTSDADEFRTLAASDDLADLEAACALHRGPLLDELEFPSEPWSEWVSGERYNMKASLIRVMLKAGTLQSRAARHEDAIATAQRLLTIEPCCEAGHRNLMLAYLYAGRRGEAIFQWRACDRTLRRELDVEPSEETLELARWIKSTRVATQSMTEVESLRQRCLRLEAVIRANGLELQA
jgi:DNA-binding SARP family transcriptional activator